MTGQLTPTPAPAGHPGAAEHLARVTRYYRTPESRVLYALLLGGTKHYGYFRPGDAPWRLRAAMRRMEDLLAATLRLPASARVLDAGCGVGDVAARLARKHGLHVTGIDILDFNLAAARRRTRRRRLDDKLAFRHMDYADLAFPDGSFDGVYTMETLVHSDRVEDVLAGFHRVLKPGGRVVLFEYSREPAATIDPRAADVLRQVNAAAELPAWSRFDHGLLEQLLAAAGFVDVHAEDLSSRMLPMLRVFAVLGWLPYTVCRLLGQPAAVVNFMAGVEFYRHQNAWRYNVYQATRPAL